MLTLVETPTFLRCISAIWADDELMEFKVWLVGNALSGDVIPGTQGLRKIRWSRRGMGSVRGAGGVLQPVDGWAHCVADRLYQS